MWTHTRTPCNPRVKVWVRVRIGVGVRVRSLCSVEEPIHDLWVEGIRFAVERLAGFLG